MPIYDLIQPSGGGISSVLNPSTYGNGGYAVSGGSNVVVTNPTAPVVVGNSASQSGAGGTQTSQEAVLDPGTQTVADAEKAMGVDSGNTPVVVAKRWYEQWYVWALLAALIGLGYFIYKKTSK